MKASATIPHVIEWNGRYWNSSKQHWVSELSGDYTTYVSKGTAERYCRRVLKRGFCGAQVMLEPARQKAMKRHDDAARKMEALS